MNVFIVYRHFYDHDGEKQLIGGIQTYISQLALLCHDMGMNVSVYQPAYDYFEKIHENFTVFGFPCAFKKEKLQISSIVQYLQKKINYDTDIVIFAADHYSYKNDFKRSITIQHGISWDLPGDYLGNNKFFKFKLAQNLKKIKSCFEGLSNFEKCKFRVCVDYNYMNWHKTLSLKWDDNNSWVIPNFCNAFASKLEIEKKIKNKRPRRILFARRFTAYRGLHIMAEVVKSILEKHSEIHFTFAGEGPGEDFLHEQFSNNSNVQVIKYLPEESLGVLLGHDIAIVPSVGSEGTSLAVAEAMGAGCVVVASAVGGITNMIIDGYNGILVKPDAISIINAIEKIMNDSELEKTLALEGYKTALNAFSLQNWQDKWKDVIGKIIQI